MILIKILGSQPSPKVWALLSSQKAMSPYAVVMDIGLGAGTVTIFSSNLGDGSMYGGTPGGIEDENTRKTSINFVMIASGFIDKMKLTAEFPLSLKNNVKFI